MRIAVFDSGLGSLAVVRELQKRLNCTITYLADRASFPYGAKDEHDLDGIMRGTISALKKYEPDHIVVGSNTPSIVLGLRMRGVSCVRPPVREAIAAAGRARVAILGTSMVKGPMMSQYIKSKTAKKVVRIDCSHIISMVEAGAAANEPERVHRAVSALPLKGVGAATISSTHLSFVRKPLEESFPRVRFLDPAPAVARRVAGLMKGRNIPQSKARLEVYCTRDAKEFQAMLDRMGVGCMVRPLRIYSRG